MSDRPNPLKILWSGDWALSSNIWLNLVDMDSDGNILSSLASLWNVSQDGLVWTFIIREAYWSDGSLISVEDVINSLSKAAIGTSHSLLSKAIKEIIKVTDFQIRITLTKPLPTFLVILSFADWSIVSYNGNEINYLKVSGFYKINFKESTNNTKTLESNMLLKANTPIIAKFKSYSSCYDFKFEIDKILSIRMYEQDLTEECKRFLIDSNFSIITQRKEWLQRLNLTKRGLNRFSKVERFRLFVFLSEYFILVNKENLECIATGPRSNILDGALSFDEYNVILKKIKDMYKLTSCKMNFPLKIASVDRWKQWQTISKLENFFKYNSIQYEIIYYNLDEFSELLNSGELDKSFDFYYLPLGSSDPEPDTVWSFILNSNIELANFRSELINALSEQDRKKRFSFFKSLNEKLILSAQFFPLEMTGDCIALHNDYKYKNLLMLKSGLIFNDIEKK